MKRTYLWLFIAWVTIVWSWVLFFMNVRLSEEFTGWVKVIIANTIDNDVLQESLTEYLTEQQYQNTTVLIQKVQNTTEISIKTKVENDEKVNELSKQIEGQLLEWGYISTKDDILSQTITGPSVGNYMQTTARNALLIGIALMVIYMLFSFAAIRKAIPPTILATVTIITMIFDISIPAGAYGFLMMINNSITLDTIFIIAILANIWYSINDTIVIFDRIRENIQNKNEKNIVYGKVFDDSLWQTMRRSIGTSLSTLLVIAAMYIFGTGAIKTFSFTIGVGVIWWTFSSLFIATPLAYLIMGKYKKEKKVMLLEK